MSLLSNASYNAFAIDVLKFAELELRITFDLWLLFLDPLNDSFGKRVFA